MLQLSLFLIICGTFLLLIEWESSERGVCEVNGGLSTSWKWILNRMDFKVQVLYDEIKIINICTSETVWLQGLSQFSDPFFL